MAIYIQIMKVEETTDTAKYAFCDAEEELLGHVTIRKADGQVELLDIRSDKQADVYLLRVARKLTQHRDRGEYPDRTSYAA